MQKKVNWSRWTTYMNTDLVNEWVMISSKMFAVLLKEGEGQRGMDIYTVP